MNSRRDLITLIDSLISLHADSDGEGYHLSFWRLDEEDQQRIAVAFEEYYGRNIESITDNKKFGDIVDSLLKMVRDDKKESADDFVQCLKRNMVAYYAESAQALIDERCSVVEEYDLLEIGMHRVIDRNHGDSVVRSFR